LAFVRVFGGQKLWASTTDYTGYAEYEQNHE